MLINPILEKASLVRAHCNRLSTLHVHRAAVVAQYQRITLRQARAVGGDTHCLTLPNPSLAGARMGVVAGHGQHVSAVPCSLPGLPAERPGQWMPSTGLEDGDYAPKQAAQLEPKKVRGLGAPEVQAAAGA